MYLFSMKQVIWRYAEPMGTDQHSVRTETLDQPIADFTQRIGREVVSDFTEDDQIQIAGRHVIWKGARYDYNITEMCTTLPRRGDGGR